MKRLTLNEQYVRIIFEEFEPASNTEEFKKLLGYIQAELKAGDYCNLDWLTIANKATRLGCFMEILVDRPYVRNTKINFKGSISLVSTIIRNRGELRVTDKNQSVTEFKDINRRGYDLYWELLYRCFDYINTILIKDYNGRGY